MGLTKVIETKNALSSTRHQIDLPAGRYSWLKLTFRGTSDTAQQMTLANLGRVSILRNGRQIQREECDFYHNYANLKRGFPRLTQATAGANRIDVVIPFFFPGIPNTLDVTSKEEVDVIIELESGHDTEMVDSTLEVIGYMQPAIPERYELHVSEQDVQASASGELKEQLGGPNIGALYLQDGSSVVDAVTFEVDGLVVVDRVDDEHLRDITRLLNELESAPTSDYVEINLAAAGMVQEVVNTNAQLTANFTGSGTLEVTKFRVVYNETDAEASIRRANAWLQSRVSPDMPTFLRSGAFGQ